MSPSGIAVVSMVVSIAAVVVAVFGVYVPWKHQHDRDLFQQAVLSLERAYRAFSNDGKNIKPPLADRVNWLTAARHLQGYKALKARVKTTLFRSLCEEHEEFWRHQFYLCLGRHNIRDASYYEGDLRSEFREQIDPTSAIIIHSFASWPIGKTDSIDTVDIAALLQESDPLKGNTGLNTYLRSFPRLFGES